MLIAPYFLILFTATRIPHRRVILTGLSIVLVTASFALAYWYLTDKYSALIEVARASGKDINNVLDLFFANTMQRLDGQELTTWNYLQLIFANAGDVLYELIRRMAVFYFLFAIYAYIKNIGFDSQLKKRVWIVYVLVNIGMLLVYSLYNTFLVSRYTMASALTLLILAPFVINQLIEAFSNYRFVKRASAALALGLLVLVSLEGLDVRTKKEHIKQAGLWLKNNVSRDARIYSNDPLIIYYAGLGAKKNISDRYSTLQLWQYMDSKHTHNFDYVALADIPDDRYRNRARETLWYIYDGPKKIVDGIDERKVYIFNIHPD